MFKIYPMSDDALKNEYLTACHATTREGAFVYLMEEMESGRLMAIAQFEIFKDYGYIYDIKHVDGLDDFEAMFILTRQTMNFIEKCGPTLCRAGIDAADERLLLACGFKRDDNGFSVDMTNMFTGGCGHH